ncbi:hypothetical protein GO755_24500 [Spirosoma sp. HMF4905]|uniref:Uncharacterized protein n=1 Tax=Spirosoma arboris TaxID=2682092 RepID=A0A7K1SHM8_9BACT|nr:hypothetical protein [Spirosoma arboris]
MADSNFFRIYFLCVKVLPYFCTPNCRAGSPPLRGNSLFINHLNADFHGFGQPSALLK